MAVAPTSSGAGACGMDRSSLSSGFGSRRLNPKGAKARALRPHAGSHFHSSGPLSKGPTTPDNIIPCGTSIQNMSPWGDIAHPNNSRSANLWELGLEVRLAEEGSGSESPRLVLHQL